MNWREDTEETAREADEMEAFARDCERMALGTVFVVGLVAILWYPVQALWYLWGPLWPAVFGGLWLIYANRETLRKIIRK